MVSAVDYHHNRFRSFKTRVRCNTWKMHVFVLLFINLKMLYMLKDFGRWLVLCLQFTLLTLNFSQGSTDNRVHVNNNNKTRLPQFIMEANTTVPPLVKISVQHLNSFVRPRSPSRKNTKRWKKRRRAQSTVLKSNSTLGEVNASKKFTVVVLTNPRRKGMLTSIVEDLIGFDGLDSAIIIWNGALPTEELYVPKTPFPVHVLSNGRNSLTNRFLPLNLVKTDAILSLDDDVIAPRESVAVAFKVWQQYPDRIVGYPARGTALSPRSNTQWRYTHRRPETTKMVLTGFAFLHKKYLELFTYQMASTIRTKIDNVTNCEDIAMNFMVAHLIHKPPIVVPYSCDCGCKGYKSRRNNDSLAKHRTHYKTRSQCVNFLTDIYGYNPLILVDRNITNLIRGKGLCS